MKKTPGIFSPIEERQKLPFESIGRGETDINPVLITEVLFVLLVHNNLLANLLV